MLTDERINELALLNIGYDRHVRTLDFARAIEREVLAAHNAGATTEAQPSQAALSNETPKQMLERMYREMKALGPFEQIKLELEHIAQMERIDREGRGA